MKNSLIHERIMRKHFLIHKKRQYDEENMFNYKVRIVMQKILGQKVIEII